MQQTQFVTLNTGRGQHRKYLPRVFTQEGIGMLASVLRSEVAVKVSIQIMKAFVEMRTMLNRNASLFQRLDRIELKQLQADENFEKNFQSFGKWKAAK